MLESLNYGAAVPGFVHAWSFITVLTFPSAWESHPGPWERRGHPHGWSGRSIDHAWGCRLNTQTFKGKFLSSYFFIYLFSFKRFPAAEEEGEGYAYFFPLLGKTVSFAYVWECFPKMHAVQFSLPFAVFIFVWKHCYSGWGTVLLSEMKTPYCFGIFFFFSFCFLELPFWDVSQ